MLATIHGNHGHDNYLTYPSMLTSIFHARCSPAPAKLLMPLPPRLGCRLGCGLGLGQELDGLVDRGDGVEARGSVADDGGHQQDEGVGCVFLAEGVGFGGRLEQGGGG